MNSDTHIDLTTADGGLIGRLRRSVLTIVAEAEHSARAGSLSKSTAISQAIRKEIQESGYNIAPDSLAEVCRTVELIRRGQPAKVSAVVARSTEQHDIEKNEAPGPARGSRGSMQKQPSRTDSLLSFFEAERTYPDDAARAWYDRLVGLDDHKSRLLIELEMLLHPDLIVSWSKKHHRKVLRLCELQQNRVPLVLLEGDVGTGKTALAETIGDPLSRLTGKKTHLLKINTQIRGTGQVGEMTDLIVQAFVHAEVRARSLAPEPVLLLIDEADALASSRDMHQMHHEDKAGLNTLLQRLDNLRLAKVPLAAIFITNRPEALDSAISRRAALKLKFERPTPEVRELILRESLPEIEISNPDMKTLLKLTSESEPQNGGISFTSSDITDRLLPAALRVAFSDKRALTVADIVAAAKQTSATPRFGGHTHAASR
jgi:AAA+ superfamily predicted ATPase